MNSTWLVELRKKLSLKQCPSCRRFFVSGKWKNSSFEIQAERIISRHLRTNPQAKKLEIQFDILKGRTPVALVQASAEIDGEPHAQKMRCGIHLLNQTCPNCARRSRHHYDGVVQLRANGRRLTEDEKNEARQIAGRLAGTREATCLWEEETRGGLDFYISPARTVRQIAKHMRELGATLSESTQYKGQDRQTGKALFKLSIICRLHDYEVGDIIKLNNKFYTIVRIGTKTQVADQFGKKSYPNLTSAELATKKEDLKTAQVLSRDSQKNKIHIMTEDYKTRELELPKCKTGATARYFLQNNKPIVFWNYTNHYKAADSK